MVGKYYEKDKTNVNCFIWSILFLCNIMKNVLTSHFDSVLLVDEVLVYTLLLDTDDLECI